MKKIAILSALTLTMSLGVSADQTKDEGWYRDDNNYQKYWVNSTNSDFQGRMKKVQYSKESNPFLEFRLVIEHEYCKDKAEDFSKDSTIQVNNRNIIFRTTCFANKTLNLNPISEEGSEYVLKQFYQYSAKNVTFVIPYKNSPDWVFKFPTNNFRQYFKDASEHLKQTIN